MKISIIILSLICYLLLSPLTSALIVSVPSLMGMPDTTVIVSIFADDATSVAGGLLVLRFDPTRLHVQSVQKGDLIVTIGRTTIESAQKARDVFKDRPGGAIMVRIERGGNFFFVTLKPRVG